MPILNMAEQLNDPKWRRLPENLNELHIPVPYVIGPFYDVTKRDDPDGQYFKGLVAGKMWTTARDSEAEETQTDGLMDRVLPCRLVQGFSARYLLGALSQGKPSWDAVWADKSDRSYWVRISWIANSLL